VEWETGILSGDNGGGELKEDLMEDLKLNSKAMDDADDDMMDGATNLFSVELGT
jgi:hypothetical protein